MCAAVSNPLAILVADSNQTRRQLLAGALRRRPEFRISACALDLAAIAQSFETAPFHVAVMSIDQPKQSGGGLAVVRRFHIAHPEAVIVLLLDDYDRETVFSAFRSGARGLFCLSQQPFRALCKCIHSVHAGQIWANSEQLRFLVELADQVSSVRMVDARGVKLLTAREEQVVALVVDGLSNREVAQELNLSEHTVKKYLFRIFEKLGISSRVELVLYAFHHGDTRPVEWLAGA
ncbi:MAG: response regulator transcription factor [Acidobacteria bacterium]|nr:response regulator transcription factor [Acidobacteriota bacterium]